MPCEYYSDKGMQTHCVASLDKIWVCRAASFKDCDDRKNFEDGIDWKCPTLEEVNENFRIGRIWRGKEK